MRVFKVANLVIGRHLRRIANELVGYPAQLGYFSGGEETRNDDEAVLAISVSSESESIVFLDPCRP
jgi:hypothetical protein